MMPEQQQRILGYFIEEAKDHLNTIEQGLLNLQATIQDPERMSEVFRAAHSVKGGAAMLSLGSIQQTSHRLEDYFKDLKEAPTTQVDRDLETMFLQIFDGLQALLEELQGPFGLTEDKAQEVMADIEPVFDRLESHLNELVAMAPAAAPEPAVPVPATTSTQSPRTVISSEDSALKLVFSSDVPGYLREMLTLFKQADTEASRSALQVCCDSLKRVGEQFDLNLWCELTAAVRKAIGNREQLYRSLAPVVIKELKRAQEQVLAGQANEIVVSPELEALLPILAEPDVEVGDIDSLLDDALASTAEADLSDLFDTKPQPAATDASADDLDWLDSAADDQATDVDDLADSLSVLSDESLASGAPPQEPTVGAAELNSLADLFEGEVAELDSPWDEISESEAAIADTPNPDIDPNSDFSDLLDSSLEADDAAANNDFADLFGESENASEADGLGAVSTPTDGNDLDDLLNLSADVPENGADAITDDGLEALLNGFEEPNDASTPDDLALSLDLETAADDDAGDDSLESNDFDVQSDDSSAAATVTDDFDDLFSQDDAAVDAAAVASDDESLGEIGDPWSSVEITEPVEDNAALDALDNLQDEPEPADASTADAAAADFDDLPDLLDDFPDLSDVGDSDVDDEIVASPLVTDNDSGVVDEQIDDVLDDLWTETASETTAETTAIEPTVATDNLALELSDLETSDAGTDDLSDLLDETAFPEDISSEELTDGNAETAVDADALFADLDADADESNLEDHFGTVEDDATVLQLENDEILDEANLTANDQDNLDASLIDNTATEFGDELDGLGDFDLTFADEDGAALSLESSESLETDAVAAEASLPDIATEQVLNIAQAASDVTESVDDDFFGITADEPVREPATAAADDIDEFFSTPEPATELTVDVQEWSEVEAESAETIATEAAIADLAESPAAVDEAFDTAAESSWSEAIDENDRDISSTESDPNLALSDDLDELDLGFDNIESPSISDTPDFSPHASDDIDVAANDIADFDLDFDAGSDINPDANELDDVDLDFGAADSAADENDLDLDLSFDEASDTSSDIDDLGDLDLNLDVADSATDDELDLDFSTAEDAEVNAGTDDWGDLDLEFDDAAAIADGGDANPGDSEPDLESLIIDAVDADSSDAFTSDDITFDDLDAMLEEPSDVGLEANNEESTNTHEFDDLDELLSDDAPAENFVTDIDNSVNESPVDFNDLNEFISHDESMPAADSLMDDALGSNDFGDLEKLLEEADQTLGGSASTIRAGGPGRSTRRVGGIVDQTMRVSVKHLDNLNNLVGELVVNRNSLEQDQERFRQFLDNLLFQVQQLNDVGQRMRDLYERSLLESSLLASRQAFQSGGSTRSLTRTSGNGDNHATGADFDALEMDRFTGFHTLTQEMIELIVRVRESSSDIAYTVESTDQIARQFRQVTTQLQEGLNKARMIPFAQTADRLPRAVRDISIKCGKEARLIVEGRDTLIDKMLLERLYDPMTHLVNNAITHGIESPEERAAIGKPREGTITVRAFYQGNQTVIYIEDDGGGINADIVKSKAIQRGLITQTEAENMNMLEIYELLFRHGFSTRDQADDFAGRGVGMDVVRTALSEIRGSINIDSELGKGTSFTIRLPLTLSISKALSCLNNQARIAFPMDGVEDMFDVPRDRIHTNEEGHSSIQWRDMTLGFQPLSELLQFNRSLGRGRVYGGSQDDDMVSVVVLRNANTYIGIEVDRVLGEQEIVIKQIEGPVPKPMGIAGATVLGDGRVMPIGDVLELIDIAQGRVRREAGSSLWSQVELPPQEEEMVKTEPTVLIVDDSITVRELLSMSFNKVGYRVEQARDGQEAWEKMRSGLPCDLVFCDIEMPRMDGLELLSRMQKDNMLKQVPIAMLTSRGADRHRQMAVDLGANGYFTKPYLEEALLDAAQRMLKGEVLINQSTEEGE
ncbi:MAG: response regulator [Cyanobacteria bacterium P01_C01_bin.120]